jgi:hypothetical protein
MAGCCAGVHVQRVGCEQCDCVYTLAGCQGEEEGRGSQPVPPQVPLLLCNVWLHLVCASAGHVQSHCAGLAPATFWVIVLKAPVGVLVVQVKTSMAGAALGVLLYVRPG